MPSDKVLKVALGDEKTSRRSPVGLLEPHVGFDSGNGTTCIKSATLALQRIDNVERGNSLPLSMLCIGNYLVVSDMTFVEAGKLTSISDD